MEWSRLKKNRCPNCNKDWSALWGATFEKGMIVCKCGFKISEKRMSEIVTDKIDKEILESLEMEVSND